MDSARAGSIPDVHVALKEDAHVVLRGGGLWGYGQAHLAHVVHRHDAIHQRYGHEQPGQLQGVELEESVR